MGPYGPKWAHMEIHYSSTGALTSALLLPPPLGNNPPLGGASTSSGQEGDPGGLGLPPGIFDF